MQAHVLAHFIDQPVPSFPFLCLTVSGGHTQILMVHDYLDMEVIGETQELDYAAATAEFNVKLTALKITQQTFVQISQLSLFNHM